MDHLHKPTCVCGLCTILYRIRVLVGDDRRHPKLVQVATDRLRVAYTQLLDLVEGNALAAEHPQTILTDPPPPPGGPVPVTTRVVPAGPPGATSVPPRPSAPSHPGGLLLPPPGLFGSAHPPVLHQSLPSQPSRPEAAVSPERGREKKRKEPKEKKAKERSLFPGHPDKRARSRSSNRKSRKRDRKTRSPSRRESKRERSTPEPIPVKAEVESPSPEPVAELEDENERPDNSRDEGREERVARGPRPPSTSPPGRSRWSGPIPAFRRREHRGRHRPAPSN